jgi:SPP1 gp7 family putative phage head morphogenesis protein
MMDKIDAWAKHNGAKSYTEIVKKLPPINTEDYLLSSPVETEKLVRVYRSFAGDQLKRQRAKLLEELGVAGVQWNVTDPLIDQYVRLRRKDLKEINNLTFKKVEKKVADAVAEAVKENQTVNELARNIKEYIRDVEVTRKNQSKTIARTETGIISSNSRYNAFKSAGIEYHQWVNAEDERVRMNHQNDPVGDGGVVRKVGELFPKTHLHHPQDSAGEPGEIINCRCVALAVADMEGSDYES